MQDPKLHILAIAVHPDDIELGCAGILIKHAQAGQMVGILDLTRGELGTRGTPDIRVLEADAAAKVMGVSVRENAGMRDGFFANDEAHQIQLIPYLRRWRPEIVITNSLEDRHPDHGRAGKLVADACFLAGLRMIKTEYEGQAQEAWRPKRVFHMIQDRLLDPTFVVDVTDVHGLKLDAIRAYKSQFHNPESNEPETYISSQKFLDQVIYRDALMGKRIGTSYGEGLVSENLPGVADLNSLVLPEVA
jgi:bacillithiol biosynthesis deacetylase BshB1